MAVDRLLPVSTTPGAVTGDSYMDAVQEEVTALWNTGTVITLSGVAGTANAIVRTATPAMTAGLANGMNFILRATATNTSTVTLNINLGGAVAVVDGEGTALTAGAIRSGGHYLLTYNSTSAHFRIVGYTPAAAVVVGSKLIKTQTASASASLDFVNGVSSVVFDDTYDAYEIVLSNLKPATDDVELWMRIGTGGGPIYQTANYRYVLIQADTGANINRSSASDAKILLAGGSAATASIGNATGENVSATVTILNPETTDFNIVYWIGGGIIATGNLLQFNGSGNYAVGTAITAIRFMFESGNITSGRASLYGITKA
jgi:hypothetical protein